MQITDLEHVHTSHCWWNWADESWVCDHPVHAGADPNARPAESDPRDATVTPPDPGGEGSLEV